MKKHSAHIILTFTGVAAIFLSAVALMQHQFYIGVAFGIIGAYANATILSDDYRYHKKKELLSEMFADANGECV
jgi:hypothetical protein